MHLFGHTQPALPTQAQLRLVCLGANYQASRLMRRVGRGVLLVSLLLFSAVENGARELAVTPDEGIRVDLPLNGQLRVQNQFGDVDIRVGKEREVLVAAKIESADIQR